jgi:hypothetical protein
MFEIGSKSTNRGGWSRGNCGQKQRESITSEVRIAAASFDLPLRRLIASVTHPGKRERITHQTETRMKFIQEYSLLIAVATPAMVIVGIQIWLFVTGERGTLLLPSLRPFPSGEISNVAKMLELREVLHIALETSEERLAKADRLVPAERRVAAERRAAAKRRVAVERVAQAA